MQQNVGGIDRTGRLVIGALAVLAGIAAVTGYWAVGIVTAVVTLAIGAILLVTGTTRKCPINDAAGVDTTK